MVTKAERQHQLAFSLVMIAVATAVTAWLCCAQIRSRRVVVLHDVIFSEADTKKHTHAAFEML